MKKIIPFIIVSAFVIPAFYFSYQDKDDPNEYASYATPLLMPFDTAKVLAMMRIVDSVNEVAVYFNELDKSLYPKIDTIDLIDMHWACDCPNWRYADSSTDLTYPANKDFYIEAADEKLELPEHLRSARIQFIGREYGGIGYPRHPRFIDPNPPMGRVFKYYAYKIYKPFEVYGPDVKSNTINEFEPTHLIVK